MEAIVTRASIMAERPLSHRYTNWALKYFRDHHEAPVGNPAVAGGRVELFQIASMQLPAVQQVFQEDYTFDWSRMWTFSWRQALRGLGAEYVDELAGDAGVVDFWCAPLPDSYDHQRASALIKHNKPIGVSPQGREYIPPLWDFFVMRGDGLVCRFHTSQNSAKISFSRITGFTTMLRLGEVGDTYRRSGHPAKGIGKSMGRGTFKRFQQGNYEEFGQAARGSGTGGAPAQTRGRGEGQAADNHPGDAAPPPPPPPPPPQAATNTGAGNGAVQEPPPPPPRPPPPPQVTPPQLADDIGPPPGPPPDIGPPPGPPPTGPGTALAHARASDTYSVVTDATGSRATSRTATPDGRPDVHRTAITTPPANMQAKAAMAGETAGNAGVKGPPQWATSKGARPPQQWVPKGGGRWGKVGAPVGSPATQGTSDAGKGKAEQRQKQSRPGSG